MKRLSGSFWVLLLFVVGCAQGEMGTDDLENKEELSGKAQKPDQWNERNNPQRFKVEFEYDMTVLSRYASGETAQRPWPSDYWAMDQDSINFRFHGPSQLSPAEKFDKAFHYWTPDPSLTPMTESDCKDGRIQNPHNDYYDHLGPVASWQHEHRGLWAARNGVDDDGDGRIDECGGDLDGIESWWGLCHAWVPASILEPEPLHPVTVNGVTFTVSDIKALLIAAYDGSRAHVLGGRCNSNDESSRATRQECRDTNAGSFHVVIVNMLGIMGRAFAEDRSYGYQVWNQPVVGYTINQQQELSEQDVMVRLGHPGERYSAVFNSRDAVKWFFVDMSVNYVSYSSCDVEDVITQGDLYDDYLFVDNYKYIVEVDDDGQVVGGEWISKAHPDFLWLPISAEVGNPNLALAEVRHLLALSRQDEPQDMVEEIVKTYGGEFDMEIPASDKAGISASILVTDDFELSNVMVEATIDGIWPNDVQVFLTRGNTKIMLANRDYYSLVEALDEQLCSDYTFECFVEKIFGDMSFELPPNEVKLNASLCDFNGQSAAGEWTLHVLDLAKFEMEDPQYQGPGRLASFKLHLARGVVIQPSIKTFEREEMQEIPDGKESGIVSELPVRESGFIRKMHVTVDITHGYVGDLVIVLEKDGLSQTLRYREGGSEAGLKRLFLVDSFNGASIYGDWHLRVSDESKQVTGILNSWSIEAEVTKYKL